MTRAEEFVGERASRGTGPPLREAERRRGPMPHAAGTWLRLQCGARAPEGRARARGAHSGLRGRRGGEEESVPSPGRARDAAAPALLVFWNLPQAGARGRMGGRRGGGGEQRPRAGHRRRHEEGARPPLSPLPSGPGAGAGPGRARLCPRPALASRRPRPLTWVAFPHGLRGEEERALLDERLMEAVELPVHVGVGDSGGEGGVGEARAARRRLRSAHAGGGVPLGSGGRRGMNGAAGGRARYLYAAPARARPPRAPLRRSAGADGAARRGQLGRNHRRAAGRGAAARPCSERRTIVSVRSKW